MTNPKAQSFFRYFPVSERDRKWGLYTTSAGEARVSPGSPYPPCAHPKAYNLSWSNGRTLHDFAVIYIARGRGWFESREAPRRAVESGCALLLSPGAWHRYRPDPGTGWCEYWVCFDGETARGWLRHGFLPPGAQVVKVKREEPVLGLFTDILDAARRNPPALQQVLSAAASRLLAHIDSDRQSAAAGQAGPAEAAIQEAIRRMNTQIGAPLDLGGLARDLHVSYTWFRRAFLQRTGLSPHQYHLHLRLARARAVLAESALTVRQAAFEAGFESEQYFCRLFKSKTGLTPGAWRRRMRQG